tara:strand:+ start:270 stop:1112 length:843 start_codon:yes stop_codon:yes gene_type:complete
MKISVVIPSVGGSNLKRLIASLELSYHIPDEIICVLPKKTSFSYPVSNKLKIKTIFSNFRNQVQQRIVGLKHVKNELILQLDDDVLLDKYTLMHLYNALIKRNFKNTIVGPIFFTRDKQLHYDYNKENLLSELFKFIFCAAPFGKDKLGKISSVGLGFGVNYNNKANLYYVDWLAGGCILYHKNNRILKFPNIYEGKSYCEDLIHSILRKKKNICHLIVRNSKIRTDKINYEKLSFVEILREFKIRKNLLRYIKGNRIRFYIWCIFEVINRIFKRINFLK